MRQAEREQAQQWLTNLAAALIPWQLVLTSSNDLLAGVMAWTYPGPLVRAASLGALRELLASGAEPRDAGQPAATTTETERPSRGGCDPSAPRPLPQQILPIDSAQPGALELEQDSLFFLLGDDLPDGELEEALELVCWRVPPERRRVLCILPDACERRRLRQLQTAGVDGLCTLSSLGHGRLYTALAAIATGGLYIDELFHQRLHQSPGAGGGKGHGAGCCLLAGPEDLEPRERRLLRNMCRGYNSPEIARRHGLSENSVRRHISHTYQRIGVRDRAQAIGWCVANGVMSAVELQKVFLALSPPLASLSGDRPEPGA
jgi:DNA-binding NarL/FixJ family response regulator